MNLCPRVLMVPAPYESGSRASPVFAPRPALLCVSRGPRRIAALLLLAVLHACASGARTARPEGAGAAPTPGFEPYPAAEIAGVKDPHAYKGKALCQRCHQLDLKLTNQPDALCRECHRFGGSNHPVDVVQEPAVDGLPLAAGSKVACYTCHDPHQKKTVLRKPFDQLCQSCHSIH